MKELNEIEKGQVLKFISSCNEMVEGKFILADNKINIILKTISECPPIYDLLNNCMKNFNFNRAFAIAKVKSPTRPGYLVVPENPETLLPLVFCLLIDIQNHSLDFAQFLQEYFSVPEDGAVGYTKFGKQIINPFKNTIAKIFNLPDNTILEKQDKEEENTMEENKIDLYAQDIERITDELLNAVSSEKKVKEFMREDAEYLLNALKVACNLKNIKFINALIIAFGYIQSNFKSAGFLNKELKQRLIDFYQN